MLIRLKITLLYSRHHTQNKFCKIFKLLYSHLIIKPLRSAGFSQIKKIPYQAPPTQLEPQKCTFWKKAFLGTKYQCSDFSFYLKFCKKLPGATFLCFEFSTRVPKNGPKNGPKFKNAEKWPKPIPHLKEIQYKDKS